MFLKTSNWPEETYLSDSSPRYGNPNFTNKGGMNITDYIPLNTQIIQDKGKDISKIPSDTIGLTIGLTPTHDILGNEIIGLPDLGAIEVP